MSAAPSANASEGLVTLALIGCGERGKAYAGYAVSHPKKCKVVAVAEPRPKTRKAMVDAHRIDKSLTFESWKDLYRASKDTIKAVGQRLADAVIVAVHDHMHMEVVMAFAEQGYHILCEKPMATKLEECVKMASVVKKAGVIFGMGHVLRYSPYTKAITEIIRSGTLGKLINIVHIEPVGHYHFAHSYVRGNWSKEKDSAFSLMTKSCHDLDLICSWLSPDAPVRISSFGSLQHFKQSAKPALAGDAKRCFDCAYERQCPYSAKKIYLNRINEGHTDWPVSVIVDGIPDIESVTQALKTGPYGRCVYESDNDVVDHQVVNLEFASGATCSFTMVAFTSLICERQTRLHFSHGEIVGDMNSFTVTDFRAQPNSKSTNHKPKNEGGGHGGGDLGLIRAFVEAVRTGQQEILGTDIEEVLKSHLVVFAAEESRRKKEVIDVVLFEKEARREI